MPAPETPLFRWTHHAQAELETLLHAHVAERAFPCVGAKAAMAKGTLNVLACTRIDSAWDDLRIHDGLVAFAAAYRADPTLFRSFAEEIDTLEQQWEHYDFFFLHYKDTDKAGEDGDFAAKVAALERFDALLPRVLALSPDVLAVSGDHATPSILAGHGWQGVPALLASEYCGADHVSRFSERDCASGSLGVLPAQDLMPLVMANALRFTKYGA